MRHALAIALILFALAQPSAARSQDSDPWAFDVTLYGMLAGLEGETGVNGHTADVSVGFSDIMSHLESGFMGRAGIRKDRLRFGVDVIFMGLEGSSESPPAEVRMDQWAVEPSVGYRTSPKFEVLGGVRYNNLMGEIAFQGPLGVQGSSTQEWWDPFVGGRVTLPIKEKLSAELRGDVGGFGIGSDLALQGEVLFHLRFTGVVGGIVGYRALYTDYEDEDNGFLYKVTSYGPQLGLTLAF